MDHNSHPLSALKDETGKQQAAITPHTGGPQRTHEGEGTGTHWPGQLNSSRGKLITAFASLR